MMSSDFAIAQFKFLELILMHGRISTSGLGGWLGTSSTRTSYWDCACTFTTRAFFSGQTLFDDFYLSCYNILFTSFPVLAIGIFDEDVKYKMVRKYPGCMSKGLTPRIFLVLPCEDNVGSECTPQS